MSKDIQERMLNQMEYFGSTYREIADKSGYATSTIFRYFNKENVKIPISFVERVAPALHTTPEYLMGWDDTYQDMIKNEMFAKRKVLFDMSEKVKPKDLDMVIGILERLVEEENG